MKSRFTLILTASAICLIGCKKESESSGGGGNAASTPPSAPAAAAPAANNGQAGEWQKTASGLKYQVMKHGTGTTSPKATDTVKVHYHGTLLDGTVFDSSVQRGEPISFPLNR
jgi:peptidylprolyl isomerase